MSTPSERYWYLGYRRISICAGKFYLSNVSGGRLLQGGGRETLRFFQLKLALILLQHSTAKHNLILLILDVIVASVNYYCLTFIFF